MWTFLGLIMSSDDIYWSYPDRPSHCIIHTSCVDISLVTRRANHDSNNTIANYVSRYRQVWSMFHNGKKALLFGNTGYRNGMPTSKQCIVAEFLLFSVNMAYDIFRTGPYTSPQTPCMVALCLSQGIAVWKGNMSLCMSLHAFTAKQLEWHHFAMTVNFLLQLQEWWRSVRLALQRKRENKDQTLEYAKQKYTLAILTCIRWTHST